MSDDDREPSSDPFGPPESQRGERGMTYFGAVGWTLLSTSLYLFLVLIMMSIRPGVGGDLITNFGFQLVGTLLTFFCILRYYAPNVSIRHFLGLRGTHGGFYVLAAVLGVIIQIPTSALYDVIVKRFPIEPEHESMLLQEMGRGLPWRIAIFIIIVLAGPFLEEVFFRGALYRPLKKESPTFGVIILSSLLFAPAHLEKQTFLPIALVGITLAILRSASGSLIPSMIMHMTFNGAAFWSMYDQFRSGSSNTAETPVPVPVVVIASLGTLLLVAITHVMGVRSQTAREAREEDLV